MDYRLSFGSARQHEVVVNYSRALRLLRITIDGRAVYRHCGLLPRRRRAEEFRTAGPDVHFLIVEPPGVPALVNECRDVAWRVWLDGKPVLRVTA